MVVALVLAFIFLVSPIIGYVVVASNLAMRTKVRIGVAGVVVLTVMPILVLIFGEK